MEQISNTLEQKILDHFTGKVVRKDLTFRVKGNAVVPSYVLEYLLGQYCAVNDEEIINSGIEKVKDIIRNNFVQKSEQQDIKRIIRNKGPFKIIDKVVVALDERSDTFKGTFENLGVTGVNVPDYIVDKHNKLLSGGGVWCIVQLSYDNSDGATNRWIIESLKPIQVSGVNLEEYIEKREEFTTEEWIDLLMHSIGLNPENFNRRGKFIQLSRLLTHVENNYNFIELGPKGTGKSHIFSELSPHGVLVSGGDVTSARLFVSNTGRGKVGLVGYWDIVCMDEFEQVIGSKRADGDMVSIMQNYMANKSFNRGKETIQAYASMAFVGNTKHSVPHMLRSSHLFESIPIAYIKGAFLDRIHIYIPGWEVKILKDTMFSKEYGFIVDYLAEILRQLRKYDYSSLLSDFAELDSSYTGRDKTAVMKTFSGLVKLIYPHKKMTEKEAVELINFAVEGRKRVKDQLYIVDEVFRDSPVNFRYTLKTSKQVVEVETLENLNYGIKKTAEDVKDESYEEVTQTVEVKKAELVLQEKEVILQDNQNGVTYKKLFSDYLKGSTDIVLTDPYIRMIHQFKNLMEFCQMLSEIKNPDEEIHLHVITWNDLEHTPQSIDNFEELKDSLIDMGIHLTYEFQELHDRSIVSDNGWKIKLGRGLDIYEKTNGRFDIAEIMQKKRQCRNCEITYIKNV